MRRLTQWCLIGVFNLTCLVGGVEVIPIHHGSLILKWQEKVVYVDPWSRGDYTGQPPADLILITDIHGDHMDPGQVSRIRKEGTIIVAPAAVQKSVPAALRSTTTAGSRASRTSTHSSTRARAAARSISPPLRRCSMRFRVPPPPWVAGADGSIGPSRPTWSSWAPAGPCPCRCIARSLRPAW